MLHSAQLICSSDSLFFRKVDILKSLFLADNYLAYFFDKTLRKFLTLLSHHPQENNKRETCFFKVPYIGPTSKQFTKSLSELVYSEFCLKLRVACDTFKINCYFQLKTKTPHALCSNVLYQFRCLCDTNLVFMTTRHLVTRACEHLVSAGPHNCPIENHIRACSTCRDE